MMGIDFSDLFWGGLVIGGVLVGCLWLLWHFVFSHIDITIRWVS